MNSDKKLRPIIYGMASVVVAYAVARLFMLSMTCDEGWSALEMPFPSLFSFITPDFLSALNNHFLNSWLMNLSITIFGKHDWAVRLPALLGGILYIGCVCRLAACTVTSWRGPVLALLLFANPYLLDFLSLARGYSLGLGFMMIGVLLLLNPKGKRYSYSPILFAISALANLSFLYPFLASLPIVAFIAISRKEYRSAALFGKALLPAMASLTFLTCFYFPSMRLATLHNEFWWGSQDGLVDGTITSLVRVSLYEPDWPTNCFILIARLLSGYTLFAIVSGLIFRNKPDKCEPSATRLKLISLFFATIISGVIAEHIIFGTPLLVERGTLSLYPLIIIIIAYFAESSKQIRLLGTTTNTAIIILSTLSLLNTASNANLSHTSTWSRDACSRKFMDLIDKEAYSNNITNKTISISTSTSHPLSLRYYMSLYRMNYVRDVIPAENWTADADYIITNKERAERLLKGGNAEIMDICGFGDSILLRRIKTKADGPLDHK